ncbi:uncharacterized protein OCT59_014112 [Rhizophagus irregularis]|uniref:Uncharacterized protein n=1 Tax=Rhizophagus irregularis (strain DAOM 181602 / DAOM 197198 / MUCL 43194) TaxID=747089 RepID=U9U035_RHIID|nr:hypothetical protein GLOIN_2v1786754 [Rhizophagus irregularis DAOM 181602=DAOM 197198]PKY16269.1 hypothetical protein RhiirB3_428608 [Rhizophagus irregularis]POG61326.1 hypothetical protein GLOIN_2v1786754 [Rhizophagus irregularis DAOM 181602=DAOM 197198]UZO21725.1 hypothetical protein OCT59_014112 [Rhizophagus irregularis]CAB4467021.1 unnamed protein product [Rhizophagus irregularis]CAG8544328.1 18517_t:CDS:1 [Rhizophagus irregularis]|eukprot:XP_025168192.1 hypothetical protein GLOIN_2v1786754 [Rhizophagus irregularis DAOM 181602=DAOM 197198]
MSDVDIPSHLILTPKQKEQLCSLPVSRFTDIKWESQTDAASFLREHELILEEPKRKLKVRYSNKAKGIRLLQCCCGTDASLRPKNGNSKARKSRQTYKFVGCLAYARIKKFKNNCIGITGHLIHSKDCQRQKPSYVLDNCKKTKNEIKNYEYATERKAKENEIKNYEYVTECKTKEVDVENNDQYATKTEECNDIENDEFVTKTNAERFEKEIKAWDVSNNKLMSKDEIDEINSILQFLNLLNSE